MSRKQRDPLADFIAGLVILLALIGGIYVSQKAPCGLWKYSKVADVPARCVSHFTR
ncbi:hypothetical protein [Micromonospora sp. NPDC049240]|uniref:hypothetical protein n=1 Tax=Micromonospora sp. NPDC049240 TaxID=3155151 RepID=UPI0033D7619C